MPDIKPIETYYKGYRFRSRLEARWAVFFDAMGIKYEYEPEGFKTSVDLNTFCYLPDFYFPDNDCYGEVKGRLSALKKDSEKIAWCIDYQNTPVSNGLVLLGQIPYWEDDKYYEIPTFPYLYWDKGIVMTYAIWGNKKLHIDESRLWDDYSSAPDLPHKLFDFFPEEIYQLGLRHFASIDGMLFEMSTDDRDNHSYTLRKAFLKASRARFEHGETPRI